MMRIESLREFVTLAQTLNFKAAADILFISQPALSKHIRELEGELGCILFERDTRSVSLTRDGGALLDKAEGVLSAYNDLMLTAGSDSQRVYKVSVPLRYSISGSVYLDALDEIKGRWPHVEFRAVDCGLGIEPDDAFNQGCDLVITSGTPDIKTGGTEIRTLVLLRLNAWVSGGSSLAAKPAIALSELNGMTYRPATPLDSLWTRSMSETLRGHGLNPVIGNVVDDQYRIGDGEYALVYGAHPTPAFGYDAVEVPLIEDIEVPLVAVWRTRDTSEILTGFVDAMCRVAEHLK